MKPGSFSRIIDTKVLMTKVMLTVLVVLSASLSAFTQPATGKLEISALTGDYYIFTTYRLLNGEPFPANGLYLVTPAGVVMIDTPWDTTQFQPLLDAIKVRHNSNVLVCIATHSHDDRTGGLEFLRRKGVKTYTSRATDEISKSRGNKRAEFLFDDDTTFTVGNSSFQTVYGGHGHTEDNIVIWFEQDRILYGGCLVKSTEATDMGYTTDADLAAWPTTIRNIKKKCLRPRYVIPGHQDWRDNNALDHTLMLLDERAKINRVESR